MKNILDTKNWVYSQAQDKVFCLNLATDSFYEITGQLALTLKSLLMNKSISAEQAKLINQLPFSINGHAITLSSLEKHKDVTKIWLDEYRAHGDNSNSSANVNSANANVDESYINNFPNPTNIPYFAT